uniref:Uncharacterized protein n=1 Tax=Anguilla anguilla TaxID=7936 RepID=A0A0E9P685_ANGAN
MPNSDGLQRWNLESELLRYIGRRRQHSINVPSPRDVMLNMSASSKSVWRWSRARFELRRYMQRVKWSYLTISDPRSLIALILE